MNAPMCRLCKQRHWQVVPNDNFIPGNLELLDVIPAVSGQVYAVLSELTIRDWSGHFATNAECQQAYRERRK